MSGHLFAICPRRTIENGEDIRIDTGWDIVKNPRLDNVNTSKHHRRKQLAGGVADLCFGQRPGRFTKARYPLLIVRSMNDRKLLSLGIRLKNHRCDRARLTVGFNRFRNVDIGNDLAVDDKKGFVTEKLSCPVERSGRAENIRHLVRVVNVYSKTRAIPECVDHRVRLVVKIYHHFSKAKFSEVFGDVANERLAQKGNRRFRPINCEWEKPRAEPGGQDDRFHIRGKSEVRMGDVFNTIVTRTKLKTIRVLMVKCKHIPGFEFS